MQAASSHLFSLSHSFLQQVLFFAISVYINRRKLRLRFVHSVYIYLYYNIIISAGEKEKKRE